MNNYKVISDEDLYSLQETINRYLRSGFLLSGGISSTVDNSFGVRYYQAIYRE